MSMFRRPTDTSSDSSSENSESEEEEEIENSRGSAAESAGTEEIVGTDLAPTETLSSNDFSIAASEEGVAVPDADRHRTFMLASLLEEFCKVRAAELANTANHNTRYNRQSPEIQELAQSLFTQASRTLAAGGLVSNDAAADDQRPTRESYVAGLDKIGLQHVVDNEILAEPMIRRLSAANGATEMSLVRSDRRVPTNYMNNRAAQLNQYAWETNDLSVVSRPSAGLQLFDPRPRSHYQSTFCEKKLLGKGGFGRVYHTYNLFDNREYAVKKIPLSPRLSQKYREGGHQELTNVLREVQALAQLHHCNVVRYHATWIEEPVLEEIQAMPAAERAAPLRVQKLIENMPKLIDSPSAAEISNRKHMPDTHNDGVHFEVDSKASAGEVGPDWSHRPAVYPHERPTETTESDIWTDGHANPHVGKDNFTSDLSVYVLHVQMSMYPMTLAQYLAPRQSSVQAVAIHAVKRHCFHLIPALRILLGIICGLQYIHAKGLVHRDIKPSNIFVSVIDFVSPTLVMDGYHDVGSCPSCPTLESRYVNPRIGDFGLVAELARDSDVLGPSNGSNNPEKAVGTEYYRPPLLTNSDGKTVGQPMNEKMDVFALGVIFLEMLWRCSSVMERAELLKGCQKGKVPKTLIDDIDAEGHISGTGSQVIQCLRGMIEHDPELRWTCDQIKATVENLLESCSHNENNRTIAETVE